MDEGKRSLRYNKVVEYENNNMVEEEEDTEEEFEGGSLNNSNNHDLGDEDERQKMRDHHHHVYSKRGSSSSSPSLMAPSCQVENCASDLSEAKYYHRRHKVCELHAKAPSVLIAGLYQRFCQQCSRFHELSEFDDSKRSCRRRLAGHNERRRKSASNNHGGEGYQ